MLVLSRKLGQSIKLSSVGLELELTVIRIAGNRVQVGLTAPSCVKILRGELVPSMSTAKPPIRMCTQARLGAVGA